MEVQNWNSYKVFCTLVMLHHPGILLFCFFGGVCVGGGGSKFGPLGLGSIFSGNMAHIQFMKSEIIKIWPKLLQILFWAKSLWRYSH